MSTEAIREKFTLWRDSDFKERFNKLSFVGFAPSIAQASNFAWMGYQQAVKDMEAEMDELRNSSERLSIATLNAISTMSGGQCKADLRDAYDEFVDCNCQRQGKYDHDQ